MTALLVLCALLADPEPLPSGPAKIEVQANGTPIDVFTYKPDGFDEGPLILVFHGVLRNADVYRDHAEKMGDRFGALIAAPRFDLERFSIERYQQGGVLDGDKPRARAEWTFSRVREIADAIRRREGRLDMPFYLIGHSGGGQFLVRLAGFVETGAKRIVAANPGTHLFPSLDLPYPYGFGGLPQELCEEEALCRYLAQPLTIYLGTEDTQADQHFDQREEANRQGASRYERGRNVFAAAQRLAKAKGWTLGWRLVEAPGVVHNHKLMFNHELCARALFGETAEIESHTSQTLVVAHRGLLKHAPENTLANFRACLELRLGFEFDVRRAKDGTLVCLHDDTVDRTTNGKGPVSDLTFEDLRRLDAGGWFAPEFAGEKVPTVDEIFSLLAEHRAKPVLVAVDLKQEDERVEADVVALAVRHKVLDKLIFIGRTIDVPEVRKRLKQSAAAARVASLGLRAEDLSSLIEDPEIDWAYLRFVPTTEQVARMHAAGKRVFLAGPKFAGVEEANWRNAAAASVDAILTDYPLQLRRELAKK